MKSPENIEIKVFIALKRLGPLSLTRLLCLKKAAVILMVLFFTLALSFSPAFAESPTDEFDLKLDKKYLKGFLTDSINILTSPARFERAEWIKVSLVFGTTAALYLFDDNIQKWSQDLRGSLDEVNSKYAYILGDGRYLLAGFGVYYLMLEAGLPIKDVRVNRMFFLGVESWVISGVFTQIIKYGFHRHRPNGGSPYNIWDGPSGATANLSFVSGNSAVAWSFATIVANEFKETPYVAPIAYAFATIASLSRVYDNKHWASDIFAGAALGYFTSKAIIAYHPLGNGDNVRLIPKIDDDGVFLTLNYEF